MNGICVGNNRNIFRNILSANRNDDRFVGSDRNITGNSKLNVNTNSSKSSGSGNGNVPRDVILGLNLASSLSSSSCGNGNMVSIGKIRKKGNGKLLKRTGLPTLFRTFGNEALNPRGFLRLTKNEYLSVYLKLS